MEKKYVLFGLSPKQIMILAKAKLIGDEFKLKKEKGLLFSKDGLIKATKLLRIKILKTFFFTAGDSSIILCVWNYFSGQSMILSKWDRALLNNADLYLSFYKNNHKVKGASNNFAEYRRGSYYQVLLANNLFNNIIIDVVHNQDRMRRMIEEGAEQEHPDAKLCIYLWAGLSEKTHDTPAKMWEILVDCTDPSYTPSGHGFVIRDNRGQAVAELVENNLFIFHDICHVGTKRELEIFQKIISNAPLEPYKSFVKQDLLFQHVPKINNPGRCKDFNPPLKINKKEFIPNVTRMKESIPDNDNYSEILNILKDFAFDFKMDIIFESDELNHEFEQGSFVLYPLEKLDDDSSTKLFIEAALQSEYLSPSESYYLRELLERGADYIDLFSIGEQAIYLDSLPIAGVDENVIFVPELESLSPEMLKFILSRAKDYFLNFRDRPIGSGAKERDVNEIIEISQEVSKSSVVNYFNGKNQEEKEALVSKNVSLRQEIRGLKRFLIAKLREEMIVRKNINNFEEYQTVVLKREFDRLLSLKKIRSFGLSGNVLSIFTNSLYFTEEESGDKFKLGRMIINVHFDNGEIRFYNQTRQVIGFQGEKMHHPHVFLKGNACLGSIENMTSEFIAAYRVYDLIMLLIAFLESVNPADDAGKFYRNWPRLSSPRN